MAAEKGLREAIQMLSAAGVPSPSVDAQLLAAHHLGISKAEVQRQDMLGELHLDSGYWKLIQRRCTREPLQHITGIAHFLDLELLVGPGVFIPRPETETLYEIASQYYDEQPPGLLLELCAGTGGLAIALARRYPEAEVAAVEISADAAAWTHKNIARYKLDSRIRVCIEDVREYRDTQLQGSVDLIVANPPYIPDAEVPIDLEVAAFDPSLALYGGGADGLEIPRAIVEAAEYYLRADGWLIMEHAEQQGSRTRHLATAMGSFGQVHTRSDLTGRDRFLCAQKL